MSEKLFEIKISNTEAIQSLAELKRNIDALREAQKQLDTTTKAGSEEFATNIKELSSQYRILEKGIVDNIAKSQEFSQKEKDINLLMSAQATTINDLNTQNTALNKIKKNLNIENEQEAKLIKDINAKIDSNTDKIKENSSAVERQKMNVGNYTNSIKDAFTSINPLNGGLTGFITRSQEAGGAGKLFTQSMSGMTSGVWGLVKASLAFIATPIGAIIAGITVVVTTLYNVFKSFTPVVDKVEQAFSALSAIFSTVKNAIIGLVTGAKSLGSIFKNLGGDMRDAASAAIELKKAQQDLDDAIEQQSVNSAKARAESDKYLAMSKDLSKSETERAQMIQKSTDIMKKDFDERKKIQETEQSVALKSLAIKSGVSEKEIQNYGDNFAKMKEFVEKKGTSLDKDFENYKNSIVKKYEIAVEENQFIEKNISKQNTLLEKAQQERERRNQEAQKRSEELKQKEIKNAQDELSFFEAKENGKQKTLEETLTFEKELMDKRNAVLEVEYTNGAKTLTEYKTEKLNILKTYNDAVFQATTENLTKELELWKSQNAKKLSENKATSDTMLSAEIALQDTLYEKQKTVIDQTILDEQDKAIALQNLQNEHETAIQTLKDNYKQFQREQEKTDYELKMENMQLQQDNEIALEQSKYERKLALLEQSKIDENLTEEQYNLARENAMLEHNQNVDTIEQAKKQIKIKYALETLSKISEVLGKETIAGKAAGIAVATINTYLGATEALRAKIPFAEPFATIMRIANVATVIGTGLKQVKEIAAVKQPKLASGGFVSGEGTGTSDSIPAWLSNGESVINAKSTAMFRPLLSAMNVAGGGKAFADGGIASANATNVLSGIAIPEIKVVNVVDETYSIMKDQVKVKNRANV